MSEISRRKLFGAVAGAGALAGISGAAISRAADGKPSEASRFSLVSTNQVGVTTPPQDRLYLIALDVTSDDATELRELLKKLSESADLLMSGKYEESSTQYDAPPRDTGEIGKSIPSNLTITIGFGPSLFTDSKGKDRFGLKPKIPAELRQLPQLPRDAINPSESFGDICIQICGDNSIAVFHAGRNLIRDAFGSARVRWSHDGFSGRTSDNSAKTHRNLFGFKDGTANPTKTEDLENYVWISNPNEPTYMQGGTYLAVRKIKMHLDTWDRSSLREQEATIGRTKGSGAPLSGGHEHSKPNFEVGSSSDSPIIPKDSHLALAHSSKFGEKKMLRRGYNYENGIDKAGNIEAGLIFIAFTQSLDVNFIPVLQALGKSDALNDYISHTASAVFAIPRGLRSPSDFIGSQLFDM